MYAQLWIEWSGLEPWLGTLCSVFGQDTTLTVPLSTQVNKLGVTLRWTNIPSRMVGGWGGGVGGVEIFLAASCYRNQR